MKLIALLSWWDEDPAWLTRAVVPLGRFCDHLVAIDGAYATTPGSELSPASPGPQADAVVAATETAGLGLTLHRQAFPWWGDEVAKRSFMFRAANLVCEPGDWLFVVDADEIVRDVPASLRETLQGLDEEVASVELYELPERGSHPARRFFRWDPTLRVEGAHYIYIAGEDRHLRGEHEPDLEPAAFISGFRMEHWSELRAAARRETQLAYYERRDRLGLEQTTARRSDGEGAVYAFDPREGSRHFALLVSPVEFRAVMDDGFGYLDGQRAVPVLEDCDEESGFLRMIFDEPYRKPVVA